MGFWSFRERKRREKVGEGINGKDSGGGSDRRAG